MARVLRPGGRLVVLDFSLPSGLLRRPYRFYLHHVLPRLAGWLTGQRDAYEYLGSSIEKFPSGPAMESLDAGKWLSSGTHPAVEWWHFLDLCRGKMTRETGRGARCLLPEKSP